MSNASYLRESLERIGISSVEAKIYIALLKLKTAKAGNIAKEAQLNRTSTYDGLKRLLEKGLIGYSVKANVKWFEAVSPERLLEFLKEKQESVKKLLPELQKLYTKPKENHSVILYYGYKGVQTIFRDFLRENKPICVLDAEGQFTEKMSHFLPIFVREVEKRKIRIRHIVREGVDIKPTKTTEVRFIPKDISSEAVTDIYGDKISIIVWTDPPEGVIIQNKSLAESYRNYFELIWKIARKA